MGVSYNHDDHEPEPVTTAYTFRAVILIARFWAFCIFAGAALWFMLNGWSL